MAALAIENHTAPCSQSCQPTILIVDDDFAIRQFLRTLLTRVSNARVLDAADPFTAMRIALTVDRPVDLLISDVDLGCAIDGAQLAGRIVSVTPAVKVVLMSGDHTRECLVRPEWKFMQKPFALSALLDAISGTVPIDAPPPGASEASAAQPRPPAPFSPTSPSPRRAPAGSGSRPPSP